MPKEEPVESAVEEQEEKKQKKKKPYHTPKLTKHGDLRTITRGGGGISGDGGNFTRM